MFGNRSWVKIWKCEKGQGNYYVAQMSSSKKNSEGAYETDWNAMGVRLVGTAAKQAEKISDGDRRQIKECGVTNKYDKEKKVTYTNYVVFAFEDEAGDGSQQKAAKNSDFVNVSEDSEDELPFN